MKDTKSDSKKKRKSAAKKKRNSIPAKKLKKPVKKKKSVARKKVKVSAKAKTKSVARKNVRKVTAGKPKRAVRKKTKQPLKAETKSPVNTPLVEEKITQGEDLHLIPVEGEIRTIDVDEAHRLENIFQKREDVTLQQENQKVKHALGSRKNLIKNIRIPRHK